MEIDPKDMPAEWLEPELEDTVQAIFLNDGKPALFLITRLKPGGLKFIAPMAISPSGSVRLISSLKVTGFFSKSVELELKSKDGMITGLKIPLSNLDPDYDDSAPNFFAWAHSLAPTISQMRPPAFMFAPVRFL